MGTRCPNWGRQTTNEKGKSVMHAWVDEDGIRDGVLVVYIDPRDEEIPTELLMPDGSTSKLVVSEAVVSDGGPVYELESK